MIARVCDSIADIGAEDWNKCFPHELEDHAYLRATEEARLPGFRWRYVTIWENERLAAAVPGFLTDYALDTTLDGPGKRLAGAITRLFPGLLTLRLACLGSPVTETGRAGFDPDIAPERRRALTGELLLAFEAHAAEAGYGLMGVKDLAAAQADVWNTALAARGYQGVPGQPVAALDIDFPSLDEYFARLSYATRKDMRRKLKAAAAVRVEYRDNVDDHLGRIMELYRDTRNRAEMTFEELTPAYFRNVLAGGKALCALYFDGGDLLAANLLLRDDRVLLDKFFCMDGVKGRRHNLYFLSWFNNLRYCLAHGLTRYQSGQAGYENKLRLGSTLAPTMMHFRHSNRLVHGALRLVAPLLAADDGLAGAPSREAA